MPPAATVLKNGAAAAIRNAAQGLKALAGRGEFLVSSDVEESRQAACQVCPWYNALRDRCGHYKCGCHLRVKTRLVAEKCPDGRW